MNGIPVVTSYNYLGLIIDDALKLDLELEKKKYLEKSLSNVRRLINSNKLTNETRYTVWHQLFKSKTWYLLILTSRISPRLRLWGESFLYRGVKSLLNIRGLPNKQKLLQSCFRGSQGIMELEIDHKCAKILLKRAKI